MFAAFDRDTVTLIGDFPAGATVTSTGQELTVPINVAYRIQGSAPRTVDIFGALQTGTGTADVFAAGTATYFPFGSSGTNVLSPGAFKIQGADRVRDIVERIRSAALSHYVAGGDTRRAPPATPLH